MHRLVALVIVAAFAGCLADAGPGPAETTDASLADVDTAPDAEPEQPRHGDDEEAAGGEPGAAASDKTAPSAEPTFDDVSIQGRQSLFPSGFETSFEFVSPPGAEGRIRVWLEGFEGGPVTGGNTCVRLAFVALGAPYQPGYSSEYPRGECGDAPGVFLLDGYGPIPRGTSHDLADWGPEFLCHCSFTLTISGEGQLNTMVWDVSIQA
jgi:hypothetical protein